MRMPTVASLAALILLGSLATAAEPLPSPTPLPSPIPLPPPTPVAEAPLAFPFRTTADEAAELPYTRDFDTYVYVVNGADPLHLSGISHLATRLQVRGYPNTKFGEWYDMTAFEAEYRKIRAANVSARVVLIGFDLGAYMVRASANRLLRDGFPVAMIGYIGGECLSDTPYSRPAEVGAIVNVAGKGVLKKTAQLTGAVNVHVPTLTPWLPARPETLEALSHGLMASSARILTPATEAIITP